MSPHPRSPTLIVMLPPGSRVPIAQSARGTALSRSECRRTPGSQFRRRDRRIRARLSVALELAVPRVERLVVSEGVAVELDAKSRRRWNVELPVVEHEWLGQQVVLDDGQVRLVRQRRLRQYGEDVEGRGRRDPQIPKAVL